MVQLHKRFTDEQVKELIQKYLRKEVRRSYIQEVLGISKTRLFALVKELRHDSSSFSIRYVREKKTRAISKEIIAGSGLQPEPFVNVLVHSARLT